MHDASNSTRKSGRDSGLKTSSPWDARSAYYTVSPTSSHHASHGLTVFPRLLPTDSSHAQGSSWDCTIGQEKGPSTEDQTKGRGTLWLYTKGHVWSSGWLAWCLHSKHQNGPVIPRRENTQNPARSLHTLSICIGLWVACKTQNPRVKDRPLMAGAVA